MEQNLKKQTWVTTTITQICILIISIIRLVDHYQFEFHYQILWICKILIIFLFLLISWVIEKRQKEHSSLPFNIQTMPPNIKSISDSLGIQLASLNSMLLFGELIFNLEILNLGNQCYSEVENNEEKRKYNHITYMNLFIEEILVAYCLVKQQRQIMNLKKILLVISITYAFIRTSTEFFSNLKNVSQLVIFGIILLLLGLMGFIEINLSENNLYSKSMHSNLQHSNHVLYPQFSVSSNIMKQQTSFPLEIEKNDKFHQNCESCCFKDEINENIQQNKNPITNSDYEFSPMFNERRSLQNNINYFESIVQKQSLDRQLKINTNFKNINVYDDHQEILLQKDQPYQKLINQGLSTFEQGEFLNMIEDHIINGVLVFQKLKETNQIDINPKYASSGLQFKCDIEKLVNINAQQIQKSLRKESSPFQETYQGDREEDNLKDEIINPLLKNQRDAPIGYSIKNILISMFRDLDRDEDAYDIDVPCKRILLQIDVINKDLIDQNSNGKKQLLVTFFVARELVLEQNKFKILLVFQDFTLFRKIHIYKNRLYSSKVTLSHVAHEMRTPLNCIISMLEKSYQILGDSQIQEEMLNPALSSAQILSSFIHDLLDNAMNQAGKFQLNLESFLIKELITDTIMVMKTIVIQNQNDILYEIDEALGETIISDYLRIRQILINLISNANQFTRNGKIIIQVSQFDQSFNSLYSNNLDNDNMMQESKLERVVEFSFQNLNLQQPSSQEWDSMIKFSVIDTGQGIEQQKLSSIFRSFGKLDDQQKLNQQGVGLGLVISNNLANFLSEGKSGVKVKSEGLDKGCEFSFLIKDFQPNEEHKFDLRLDISSPIKKTLERRIIYDLQSQDGSLPLLQLKKCDCQKALVVDDSYFNCYALSFNLDSLNISNQHVQSGKECEEFVKKKKKSKCCTDYQFIFMDIQMEEQDGITTFLNIKESLQGTYVIPTTGFSSDENKEHYQLIGMTSFLIKPVDLDGLIEILKITNTL